MNKLLNGKCKQDFEKWYFNYLTDQNTHVSFESTEDVLNDFYTALPSMQWGVYVDFFESKDILVSVFHAEHKGSVYFEYDVNDYCGDNDTRELTRLDAIKRANQLYNNENK